MQDIVLKQIKSLTYENSGSWQRKSLFEICIPIYKQCPKFLYEFFSETLLIPEGMGGSVSIVNNSLCTVTVTLQILGVPYYWEDALPPGSWMNRTGVGHVWFTLEAYPWHGFGNNNIEFPIGTSPEVYTTQSGEEYTLLGRIGIRGRHECLIGRLPPLCFDCGNDTRLQRALAGNFYTKSHYYRSSSVGYIDYKEQGFKAPFQVTLEDWYIGEANTWEIIGGPHCSMESDFFTRDDTLYEYRFQVVDDSAGLSNLDIRKLEN